MAGVQRRKLDRIGGEVARATSIVKYAPQSYFSPHTHDGGEEILVIEGVFSDEHGDYPAGTYIRNPIGTSHKPHSQDGCIIFVKLHQFDEKDNAQFILDSTKADFLPGGAPGLSIFPLHSFGTEHCSLLRCAPGTQFTTQLHLDGEEILVIEGSFSDEKEKYSAGKWIRSQQSSSRQRHSEEGCLLYLKTGHLPQ